METKQFHISDVLSVTTGRLLSTRHMDGLYDIMGHLYDEGISTIGLTQCADEAEAFLLEQLPQLQDVVMDDLDRGLENARNRGKTDETQIIWMNAALRLWIDKQTELYGEFFEVPSMDRQSPGLMEDIEYVAKIKANKKKDENE